MTVEKFRKWPRSLESSNPNERSDRRWANRLTRGVAAVEALIGLTGMIAGAQDLSSQPDRAADRLKWSESAQLEDAYKENSDQRIERRDRELLIALNAAQRAKESDVEKFKSRRETPETHTGEKVHGVRSESLDRRIRDRIEQGHAEVGDREKRTLGSDPADTQSRLEGLRKKYSGGRKADKDG